MYVSTVSTMFSSDFVFQHGETSLNGHKNARYFKWAVLISKGAVKKGIRWKLTSGLQMGMVGRRHNPKTASLDRQRPLDVHFSRPLNRWWTVGIA